MGNRAWDTSRVLELILESGRMALHYFRRSDWRLKGDGTLVTQADEEIEAMMSRQLSFPEQGVYMIGEETVEGHSEEYIANALAGATWVVDPVDGTAPYAHGLEYWGISIGFMRSGVLEDGAVYLPCQRELFISDGADVLWSDEVDPTAGVAFNDLRVLEPVPVPFSTGGMVALGQAYIKGHRFPLPNPVEALGSATGAIGCLLCGRFMAYLGHMKLWDLAGGLPLMARTGFDAAFVDGASITAKVDARVYVLTAGESCRWHLRKSCVFGPRGIPARFLRALRDADR